MQLSNIRPSYRNTGQSPEHYSMKYVESPCKATYHIEKLESLLVVEQISTNYFHSCTMSV